MSAVSLLFFSVKVAILSDSLAIALAALDTTAFFAGAFVTGFAAGFATALGPFFAVAIFHILHCFSDDQIILAAPIFA
jgi:hypothetical protein